MISAALEAAAREWAAGPDSQAVVAARHGVPIGSMPGVVRRLKLVKQVPTTAAGRKKGAVELWPDDPRQTELDRKCAERQRRVLDAYERRQKLRMQADGASA